MSKIKEIHARQILDSRGNPTVEAEVTTGNGITGRASVPSGASTGKYEAVELRDGDKSAYSGKGVLHAVNNIKTEICNSIVGFEVSEQTLIDKKMIELDSDSRLRYNKHKIPRIKRFLDEMDGIPLRDIWSDINNTQRKEKLE